MLRTRGTDIDDVEHVAGGKTFFWSGVYGEDLNSRETLVTDLNVFETFEPKLSDASRRATSCSWPTSSPTCSAACSNSAAPRFVALDSMDLWINIARDVAREVIESVDCLILNDAELVLLTGKPTRARGPRGARLGPDGRRRQAGRVRRGAGDR